MSAINRLPAGWLGFLGIKNGGRYPDQTGTVLAPTWDLRELYYASNSEYLSNSQAFAAVGGATLFTVPNGEVWRVGLGSASTGTLGAGQTVEFVITNTDAAGLVTLLASYQSGARTAGQRAHVPIAYPFYVGPGSLLGISVSQLVAGPVTVSMSLQVARHAI